MKKSIENTEVLAAVNQKVVNDGEISPSIHLKDGSKVQTGIIATLVKAGLFELFSVNDWIAGANPGRCFVGECAENYLARANLCSK